MFERSLFAFFMIVSQFTNIINFVQIKQELYKTQESIIDLKMLACSNKRQS